MSRPAPLRRAISPADTVRQAQALVLRGQRAEAAALLRRLLASGADTPGARKMLAGLRDVPAPTVRVSKQQAAQMRRVHAAVQAQSWRAVRQLAEPLLKAQPMLAEMANALGLACWSMGARPEALRAFNHAIRVDPLAQDAYANLALMMCETRAFDAAREAAEAGCEVAPDAGEVRLALAQALIGLERAGDALPHLEHASRATPKEPMVWEALIRLHERSNRLDTAAGVLKQAETHCPNAPLLTVQKAVLAMRTGFPDQVLDLVDGLDQDALPPEARAVAEHARGKAMEARGNAAAAFAAYEAMNAATAETLDPAVLLPQPRYLTLLQTRLQETPPLASDPQGAETQPVFLVGFPRSGTTLLDTVLRAHPACAVVEEQPLHREITRGLTPGHEAQELAALPQADKAARRAAYLAAFERHLSAPLNGRRAVDKMPLNMTEAAALQQVFPGALFVLSLRHPCDCVLSGFMQNFQPNDAMACFLDLQSAAALYDRAFALWTRDRDVLGLTCVELRYEDMITNLRGSVAGVIDAMGLDWDDALLDHRASAAARDRIATPSYAQVSQEIYTHAAGRWTRFAPQLSGILPVLAPWADRLGYEMPTATP